jgi:tetratricopeptide (TPR) repeat protein
VAAEANEPEISPEQPGAAQVQQSEASTVVSEPVWLRPARPKNRFLKLVLRGVCLGVIAGACAYGATELLQRTSWYRQRTVQKLFSSDPQQQLRAATTLAHLKCQKELLAVLRSDVVSARELGRRALEHIWFHQAGKQAYRLLQQANDAVEKKEQQRALAILDRTIDLFPGFAEAWNRRGALYWELGDYEKSLADSEQALALNPNHYGAMQGIGVCRLQLGDVAEACRYLRAALKILPHDEQTRRSLERCEELLRVYPSPTKRVKTYDEI